MGGLIVDFGEKTVDLSVQSRVTKLNNILQRAFYFYQVPKPCTYSNFRIGLKEDNDLHRAWHGTLPYPYVAFFCNDTFLRPPRIYIIEYLLPLATDASKHICKMCSCLVLWVYACPMASHSTSAPSTFVVPGSPSSAFAASKFMDLLVGCSPANAKPRRLIISGCKNRGVSK